MKKVIIAHCWGGSPEYIWYPYVKKKLEEEGFEVIVPQFPDTDAPNLDTWLPVLQNLTRIVDEDTYLIGHSTGCITIMRLLESLSADQKVGGVVFVAGFTYDLGLEELENFFMTPINFEKIKKHSNVFIDIFSDNDTFVPVTESEVLYKELGARLVFMPGMGHFSDLEGGGNVVHTELPSVVATIIDLSIY